MYPVNSKIFLHDNSEIATQSIRNLCDKNQIIGIKSVNTSIIDFLTNPAISNSDICAIFLSEEPDQQGLTGFHIAERIQKNRKSLPIFIRLNQGNKILKNEKNLQNLFTNSYSLDNKDELHQLANKYLFGVYYPIHMVNQIKKIGEETIAQIFKNTKVESLTPFIVNDYILSNDLISILPLEMSCGKGYIMAQLKEEDISRLISEGTTSISPKENHYLNINQTVSEVVNLLSGRIRGAFHNENSSTHKISPIQIPILINQSKSYINFGNTKPQLCFRYLIFGSDRNTEAMIFDFKIVFNIHWEPCEAEIKSNEIITNCIKRGDIEIF